MFDDLIFTASSVGPAEWAGPSIGGEAGSLRPEDVVTDDEPAGDAEQPIGGKTLTDDEKGHQARRRKRARRRERFQGWRYEQLA